MPAAGLLVVRVIAMARDQIPLAARAASDSGVDVRPGVPAYGGLHGR
jgi:hypothetical protein